MNNKQLADLFNEINHISLNHEDLMEAVNNFNKTYSKQFKDNVSTIDLLFSNQYFIEQSLMAARESIVLSMMALSLDDKVDYTAILKNCINFKSQEQNVQQTSDEKDIQTIMTHFLFELRKELFSRIYSQNKEFNKVSKLTGLILQNRYSQFMNIIKK